MAKSKPWAERSGAERRRTFGSFAALYAALAVVVLAIGWIPIGVFFAIGALALAVAWWTTDASTSGRDVGNEKPDWMLAMDDPNAPDLSLPEYNTERVTGPDAGASPFDRPRRTDDPQPPSDRAETTDDVTPPHPPGEGPPSRGA